MDPVKLSQLAEWAQGSLASGDPGRAVASICTDSRKLQSGELFLALRGDNFDAHTFVAKAAEMGAAGAIVEEVAEGLPEDFAVIVVADTLAALQSIAAKYRRSLPLKVVAITGSNGKTSTKDLSAAVLGGRFRVCKTQGNFNNHIGLPLTLLSAGAADEIGVFEIGMNHPGEIAPLAALAKPDAAVITNVGVAHIEFMKTREAIALEKGMLAEVVGAEGTVFLAAGDDFTESIASRTKARVVRAGIDEGDVRATAIEPTDSGNIFTLQTDSESVRAELAIPGGHMIRNAVLAAAVGISFGLSLEECAAGLRKVTLTGGRLQMKTVGGIRVIDDSYNANPDSMIAALETLAKMPTEGRRFAVLGRMGELGDAAEEGHASVGRAAAALAVDVVIAVAAPGIAAAAREAGASGTVELSTTSEAGDWLRQQAMPGDLVLIKGSRAARMEETLARLEATGEVCAP